MDFKPEILRRYFKGEYSRKDYLWVKSVFSDPREQKFLKEELENHWFEFNDEEIESKNVDHLLQQIHQKINSDQTKSHKITFFSSWRQIAAILVVQLLLTFIATYYFQTHKQASQTTYAELQCPMGARIKFDLPDGSTGFLNSGSSIKYPVLFTENRNIELVGEAWFDVLHDTENPFTVKTQNLSIEVLGTEFNVIAFENENTEEVILADGSVKVASVHGQKLSVLKPDERLVLDASKMTFAQDEIDASQYLAWTEGMLVFRNENMEQVAKRMGRWYNVEIEITDQRLLEHSFRATFIDEPLEEVLKLLAKTAPLCYTIIEREQTNNNIYLKKRVELRFDKQRANAF
ncbi:FecR domain-containing protein [uncultured Draconibacterium sp.]|uniref:FecR family protein n=1 Tax=uncultured Draconibacterium sp. TaxID=1573823 RepID=UPI0025F7D281|nr:FecR domain-containing protein [uncultured Draconibacterium sp.]